MKKKNPIRDIIVFLLVVVVLVSVGTSLWESQQPAPPTYAEVVRAIEAEQVDEYVIDGGMLTMKLKDGKIMQFDLSDPQVRADFRGHFRTSA